MPDDKNNGNRAYPVVLNGAGCLFGQRLEKALEREKVERRQEITELQKKMDKVLWALVSLAISLASATIVMLAKGAVGQ